MSNYNDKYGGRKPRPSLHASMLRTKGAQAYYEECRKHYGVRTSICLTAAYMGWSVESVCRELGFDPKLLKE